MATERRGGELSRGWSVLAIAGVALVSLLGLPGVAALPTASAVVAVMAATAGALCWPRRPGLTVAGALSAAAMSLVDTIFYRGPDGDPLAAWLLVETAFMLVILVQVGRRPPARSALPVGLVVIGAVIASPLRVALWPRASPSATEIVGFCCCWALLAACATAIGLYLRSLDEARERSVVAARREQRVQLARDLHDWLAHEVTGIVLEAQVAQLGESDPEESGVALKRIEEAGVRALGSMDRAIQLMRAADDPAGPAAVEQLFSIADLPDVAKRFSSASSASVQLDIEEGVDDIRPEIAATVHRVILESLTNIRRHASSATVVEICVHRGGPKLVVAVTDNADGSRVTRPFGRRRRGGAGLSGLAERVDALGGTFQAGPVEPAGWSVRAVLPVVT